MPSKEVCDFEDYSDGGSTDSSGENDWVLELLQTQTAKGDFDCRDVLIYRYDSVKDFEDIVAELNRKI